ncbi:MAG: IPT/TIG domain-containing protein [Deltaproteobacteria bacterium]|nr:IPT/TIG domain-containing protein [Deltaproteobacteria bacterium]
MSRSRACLLALVALSACSRSFTPPVTPDSGLGAPTLAPIAGSVFANQTVVLQGTGFSDQAASNQVRVGQSLAEVVTDPSVGSPGATALEIVVPEPGVAELPPLVTVTVNGLTSNAQPLQYLGPGHPGDFVLVQGSDLSPTPITLSIEGGLALVSVLRNRVHALVLPETQLVLSFPATGAKLPFGAAALLDFPGHGFLSSPGQTGVALWASEFDPHGGLQTIRSTAFDTGTSLSLPIVDDGLAITTDFGNLRGLTAVVPVAGGAVVYFDAGSNLPSWVIPRDPHEGVASSASNDFPFATDAGIVELGVVTSLLIDQGGLAVDKLVVETVQGQPPTVLASTFLPVGPDSPGAALDLSGANPQIMSIQTDNKVVWFPSSSSISGSVLVSVNADDGGAHVLPVGLPFEVGSIAATTKHVAVGTPTSPELVLVTPFDDGGFSTASVQLPGPPEALDRDVLQEGMVYAVVPEPPMLVQVDADAAQVVRSMPLNNQLLVAAVRPDGKWVAVAAQRYPALAVLDGQTLVEDPAGFQHLAPPDQVDLTFPVSAAWPTPNSDQLCVAAVQYVIPNGRLDQGYEQWGVHCAPQDAEGDPTAGCDVLPPQAIAADAGSQITVAALPDGRVRALGGGQAWDCTARCPGSCADAGVYGLLSMVSTRSGDLLGVAETPNGPTLERVTPGGDSRLLCGDVPCVREGFAGVIAVDPQDKLALVLGHDAALVNLETGEMVGQLLYFSDIPASAAFSADSTRLYVGTELGHVDEYLLSDKGDANTILQPSRSIFAGFPVAQIAPFPDGSRLILTDFDSDHLHVVQ